MLIAPLVPAGTTVALATTDPSQEFRVETFGRGEPAGQAVRYSSDTSGTTVTFTAYATAFEGT